MDQTQIQFALDSVRGAIAAADKALSALTAYETKPDPILVEIAIDYLKNTVSARLSFAEALIGDADTQGQPI